MKKLLKGSKRKRKFLLAVVWLALKLATDIASPTAATVPAHYHLQLQTKGVLLVFDKH